MGDFDLDYRLPKRVTLNIVVAYTPTYYIDDDRGTIDAAAELLDHHNIGLNVYPEGAKKKATGFMLKHLTKPIPDTRAAYQSLRDDVHAFTRGSGMVTYAPVVFTQYAHAGYGIAPPDFRRVTNGCLIFPKGNDDKMDLLHELGHCAMKCSNDDHMRGTQHQKNVMYEANGRSMLYRFQVEAFGKALFAFG
jgi:hypothetical protein